MENKEFDIIKAEIDSEYGRIESAYESLVRSSKRLRDAYLTGIGTMLLALGLTGGIALYSHYNRPREPVLGPSTNPHAMVWSYPGEEYQARNFKDVKPFGSLDEVVLRTEDGKVVTLTPDNEGFQQQEDVYREKIVPYFDR